MASAIMLLEPVVRAAANFAIAMPRFAAKAQRIARIGEAFPAADMAPGGARAPLALALGLLLDLLRRLLALESVLLLHLPAVAEDLSLALAAGHAGSSISARARI